jgi:hypothetical protein
MENNSKLGIIDSKNLRVVQRGRVFFSGRCYKVASDLNGKRVRLVVDSNNLNVIKIESETGKPLGEAIHLPTGRQDIAR